MSDQPNESAREAEVRNRDNDFRGYYEEGNRLTGFGKMVYCETTTLEFDEEGNPPRRPQAHDSSGYGSCRQANGETGE